MTEPILPRSLIELLDSLIDSAPPSDFNWQMIDKLKQYPIYEDMPENIKQKI